MAYDGFMKGTGQKIPKVVSSGKKVPKKKHSKRRATKKRPSTAIQVPYIDPASVEISEITEADLRGLKGTGTSLSPELVHAAVELYRNGATSHAIVADALEERLRRYSVGKAGN